MEVREPSAKYLVRSAKQRTDIGALPLDWKLCRLGEITKLMTNGFVGTATKHYAAEEAGAIYIQGFNVEENAFNLSGVKYVTEAFHRAHQKSCLREGDLLTVQTGDVGLTTVVPPSLVGANCHALIISRLDRSVAEPCYVSQYLNCAQGRARLSLIETGTTMKHLNVGDMLEFLVPQPPIEEQREIAQSLTDADALIDSLEQLLTKKRQIKQGAMQELLTGKRRVPGFTADWATCELRQLGHVVRGVAYNPDADLADGDTEQTVRLLRSNNVQGGEIVRIGLHFVNRRRVRGDQYLQDGDLLLCMANGSRDLVGKAGRFVRGDEHSYTFGAFMSCFRPDPKAVESGFVAFLFQTHAFRQHVDLLLAGSSINNLRPEGVLGFSASIPTEPAEQVAVAQALADMDADIATIEARITKARALKQAMAQALLTGRIRLVEPTA